MKGNTMSNGWTTEPTQEGLWYVRFPQKKSGIDPVASVWITEYTEEDENGNDVDRLVFEYEDRYGIVYVGTEEFEREFRDAEFFKVPSPDHLAALLRLAEAAEAHESAKSAFKRWTGRRDTAEGIAIRDAYFKARDAYKAALDAVKEAK